MIIFRCLRGGHNLGGTLTQWRWLIRYRRHVLTLRYPTDAGPVHVLFCLADHFEPGSRSTRLRHGRSGRPRKISVAARVAKDFELAADAASPTARATVVEGPAVVNAFPRLPSIETSMPLRKFALANRFRSACLRLGSSAPRERVNLLS
jgi:hypothetical protein